MTPVHDPAGARGPASGREFDPDLSGGPIHRLSTDRVQVSDKGVDAVEGHVERFGPDAPNQRMIRKLRDIAARKLKPTRFDLNFYTHELREFVRYRRRGWRVGQPDDPGSAHDLWNHTHTAALEDYRLPAAGALYHPDARP